MQVRVSIPTDLLALVPERLAVARAALKALYDGLDSLTPAAGMRLPPATSQAPMIRIYLSPDLVATLMEYGANSDALGDFASRVINAHAASLRQRPSPTPAEAPEFAHLPIGPLRPLQRTLLYGAAKALDRGRLVIAEASTGIGKSWVLALLAAHHVHHGRRTVLAAPTLAICAQLATAFQVLGLATPLPLLGRGQFVDPIRLARVVVDEDLDLPEAQRTALAGWDGSPLAGGVMSVLDTPELPMRWLVDDLVQLAPDLPPDLVRAGDLDDPVTYRQARASLNDAQVVLTTHAMLAADLRLRRFGRNLIPDELTHLLIDEAHLLEDQVARAFSSGFSAQGMRLRLLEARTSLEPLLRANRLMAAFDRLIEHLENLRGAFGHVRDRQVIFDAGSQHRALQNLIQHIPALVSDMSKIDGAKIPGVDLTEAIATLKAMDGTASGVLTLSPRRKFPSLVVGPRGLKAVWESLWARCESALLLSATMFIDTQEHGVSAGYHSSRLCIPPVRLTEVPPVIAPWVRSTPSVFQPPPALAEALIPPPTPEDQDSNGLDPTEARYFDALAATIAAGARDAAGGALVLCTSYRAIDALAERLTPELGDRVLAQRRDQGLGPAKRTFTAAYDAGLRPVWIAAGSAWTGLDLRDERVAPEADRLLTDLFITRVPLLPAATTMAVLQRSRSGLSMVRQEVALTLRQGIGRLVRAEGQQDRRLWLLDGRLFSPQQSHIYLTAPCRRAIAGYRVSVLDEQLRD